MHADTAHKRSANLPDLPALKELQEQPQWVAWRLTERNGKMTKPPVNPKIGGGVSHSDPTTWGTYAQARVFAMSRKMAGVGFVLSEDDGYTGIDLDKCRDAQTGVIEPWAAEIVAFAESYTEISPSGTGIRMIVRGKIEATVKCDPAHVEVYRSQRYLTVTGNHIAGTPTSIEPAPRTLAALMARVEEYRPKEEPLAPASDEPAKAARAPLNFTRRERGVGPSSKPATARPKADFWKNLRDATMNDIGWFRDLFPAAKFQPGTGGWRVASKYLGRSLQEDISITPGATSGGIVDFGVADMGDKRLGKRTAVDLVMEWGRAENAIEAARWLCDHISLTMESLGWTDGATPESDPDGEPVVVDGVTIDPETGEILGEEADSENARDESGAQSGEQRRSSRVQIETIIASSLAGRPIPRQRWLVEGLIPTANVTMLSGDGATGKSLLALLLAIAVALGGVWIGFKLNIGRVLFLSAEDEVDELHRRLARVVPRLEALDNLAIVPLAGKDAVLAAPGRDGLLQTTPLFAALRHLVKTQRPELLVLDTLADIFGGDEIKKVHARQFVAFLRGLALEYDVTILLLSHPSQSGMASGDGTSGNVAWNNSVRSRLYFERRILREGGRSIEDDRDVRVLSVKKNNRAPSGGQIVVRYQDGQFVREQESTMNARDAAHQAERVFLALLAQFTRENRSVSASKGPTYAPAIFWKHPNSCGVAGSAFTRAMDRLLEDGRIAIDEFGPPSKRRQRLVVARRDDPVPATSDYSDEASATDE